MVDSIAPKVLSFSFLLRTLRNKRKRDLKPPALYRSFDMSPIAAKVIIALPMLPLQLFPDGRD